MTALTQVAMFERSADGEERPSSLFAIQRVVVNCCYSISSSPTDPSYRWALSLSAADLCLSAEVLYLVVFLLLLLCITQLPQS